MVGAYVDDTLKAGTPEFEVQAQQTESRFEAKERNYGDINFAGVRVEKEGSGYRLQQNRFINRLELLPMDAGFDEFRFWRHELAWATHTRPDLSATVAILAQVTCDRLERRHLRALNADIKLAQRGEDRGILQHKLEICSLELVVYTESSFANLPKGATQLGFIILLVDETKRDNVIWSSSYK